MAWGILAGVKERLTGAIILVALMVLLVPELLTGPVRSKSVPAPRTAGTAHARPPLRTYTLTLGAASPAAGAGTTVRAAPTASAQGSGDSAPPLPAASSAEESRPAAAAKSPRQQERAAPADGLSGAAAPRTAARSARSQPALQAANPPTHSAVREASSSSRGWVVQLGSFADHRNALRLARSLQGKGFRMSVSPARAGSRVLWRVRAGPARDRGGAQHLAARLRALGHRGEVLPAR
jgi:DedD protein